MRKTCYFAAPDEAQVVVDALLDCGSENDYADNPARPGPDHDHTCPGECSEYVEGHLANARRTANFSAIAARIRSL